MLFRVRPAPSPIRLGRPLPVPPLRKSHGEAVERNSYARTHARIHTHTQLFSLSHSRSLFCSFSHFLFPFASRRSRTLNSYDEDSLRMERRGTFPFSRSFSSSRAAPDSPFPRDCSFIFLLLLQLQGRVRFSYIPPLSRVLILCFRPEVITRVQCRGVFVLRERYRNRYFFELLFLCCSLSISRFPVTLFRSLCFSLFVLCLLIQVGYLKSRLLKLLFSKSYTTLP